jgi:F0F1-type ATP synthase assembly protein I
VTGAIITASVCRTMKERPKAAYEQTKSQGGQETAGMDQGLRVLSYLISGVLLYGMLGWLGDHYFGTRFLVPIGIVVGAAFGVYVIIRRFGRIDEAASAAGAKNRDQAAVTENRHKAK